MQRLKVKEQFKVLRIHASHTRRQDVERYVAERYAAAFNAQLQQFMPEFLVMMNTNNAIQSVCGYRSAHRESLFLEHYLPQPADEVLAAALDTNIERSQLVEFGQLASFSYGFSMLHFYALIQALLAQGFQWCIFTATDPLFAMMRRFGLKPTVLAQAQAKCIANAHAVWGSYYDHAPRIMAGDLSLGMAQLQQAMARRGLL